MASFSARFIERIVSLGLPLALVALVIAVLAVTGARLRLLPPLAAFGLFVFVLLVGGGLALLLGLVGVAHGGGMRAVAAVVIGAGCVGFLLVRAVAARAAPSIHDISTDMQDPPGFEAAALLEENRGRDLSYPNGAADSAEQQREAYPDIETIESSLAPGEAYDAAAAVAEELGWTIVARRPDEGELEATAETSVFRFVDDVVVRVRSAEAGSVIDVRSLSRVGVGDMGANAARIRAFRDALSADLRVQE